jgi:hypothetical protein
MTQEYCVIYLLQNTHVMLLYVCCIVALQCAAVVDSDAENGEF